MCSSKSSEYVPETVLAIYTHLIYSSQQCFELNISHLTDEQVENQ